MRALIAINADTDPLGVLADGLRDAGIELVHWDAQREPPPRGLDAFDAFVALGGATNPDEDAASPWLATERALLRTAVERELPTVGVCLGAELLAQALGARAYRLARGRIGWFPLRAGAAAAHDPLGGAWRSLEHALEWHSYGFELPGGATLLAGEAGAVQAFRAGRCAWGFQYHLEADAGLIRDWVTGYPEDVSAAGGSSPELLAATDALGDAVGEHGRQIGDAFARLVVLHSAMTRVSGYELSRSTSAATRTTGTRSCHGTP